MSQAAEEDSMQSGEENDQRCPVCTHLSENDTEITVSSLKTSADDGCHCCSTLFSIFDRFEDDGRYLIDSAADEACYLDVYLSGSNQLQRHAVELSIPALNILIGLSVAPDVLNPYSLPVDNEITSLAPQTNEEEGGAGKYRVPLHASVSFKAQAISTSLLQIRKWLQECLLYHRSCDPLSESFHPSRILVFGETEPTKVYLAESRQKMPYVALSYCWGQAQFLKLTTENLQACKEGIPINSLPNIFQHAIAIARGLDIYCIWIDALCILQDDLGDWEIEALKMADVYRNSNVVLAMTNASNPDEDCLGKCLNATIDNVKACLIHHPPHPGWPMSNAFPLAKRGWTFQGRLLAPRIVYFGPHELSWECQTSRDCECGRESGLEPSIKEFNMITRHSDSEAIAVLWRALVTQYSTLQFTFESDRLPALAGIVSAIQASRPGAYLAGLWSDSLILDMLWFVNEDEEEKPTLSESRLVSPSWSWASIATPVVYSTAKSSLYEILLECQIIAFSCIPTGLSFRGRIKSGWVRMECSTISCRTASASGLNKFKVISTESKPTQKPGDLEFDATLLFDRRPTSPGVQFSMIRMAAWRSIKYGHEEEQALLLRPITGLEGHLERIGIAIRGVSQPRFPWPEERNVITIV